MQIFEKKPSNHAQRSTASRKHSGASSANPANDKVSAETLDSLRRKFEQRKNEDSKLNKQLRLQEKIRKYAESSLTVGSLITCNLSKVVHNPILSGLLFIASLISFGLLVYYFSN